ncbi:MAG: PilZ domain-containing protein [Colwellia sp.]
MTTDFSKYHNIITQFRGLVNKNDFTTRLAKVTKNIPKTDMFLLKMELKRLAGPCTRLIDLRGLVDGECQIFEHLDQRHFLDDIAIKVFQENVAVYGEYCFGVYEAVKNTKNNFRIIYQKEQANIGNPSPVIANKTQEKIQYPASLYLIGNYYNRIEERMNFVTPITITLNNEQEIEAHSADISSVGGKIRLDKSNYLEIGQTIALSFLDLKGEFQFDKNIDYHYEIKSVFIDGRTQIIGCQRVNVGEEDRFVKFLTNYIHDNKRRYKINIDNTFTALRARAFEQFTLPKINELPIFIDSKGSHVLPRYALTSPNNQAVFQYWRDERGYSMLGCLVNADRMERIKEAQEKDQSIIVYSFIHQNKGKSFFYSIDQQQMAEDEDFFQQFLGFAAGKPSFAITQLTCFAIDRTRAYSPFTVSNMLSTKDQYLNPPPSDEVNYSLDDLSHIVVASDITHQKSTFDYQQLSYENICRIKLKEYGHKRHVKPLLIDELMVSYKNQRQEPRFKYKTPIIVGTNSDKWTGKSQDFSISGLKIKFDKAVRLSAGHIVYLSFPDLQKITSAFDLKALPYEVVRINKNKTTINLRVQVKEHQHIGRAFFKVLINKNKNKLTPDEYALLIPGLAKTLRTIYAGSLKIPSLMVQTSGSRYKTEIIVASENMENDKPTDLFQQMSKLSERQNYYNLFPVVSHFTVNNVLDSRLKKLLASDKSVTELLYIAINTSFDRIEQAVTCKFESELNTPELQRFFIKKSLKRGKFYCLQLKISRTNEPEMEHLNPELSYISTYAIHRGKQIEQEIWSVAGVVQLFDITQEVLFRYHLIDGY